MALVASPSSWTQSLPYAPHHHRSHPSPLRRQSATWNTKLPMPYLSSTPIAVSVKPRLRLAVTVIQEEKPQPQKQRFAFDPFADEPVASTSALLPQSQNTPPPSARGRTLTPLSITTTPTPAPAPIVGRRRAPSFSAGSGAALPRGTSPAALASLSSITLASQLQLQGAPHHAYPSPSSSYPSSLASAPSPAPSLSRRAPPSAARPQTDAAAPVPLAPSPFHARHYPTSDARARLLARTLLNRIHAVGRPRSPSLPASSPYARSASPSCAAASRKTNGYESECGARGYVPSRLSECTMAA